MQLFSRSRQPSASLLLGFGLSLLACCLLGIFSRPENMLAVVWISNALLMGWLLRRRRLAGIAGWSCAAAAFISADLVTGSSLELSLHMTAANLLGVAAGYLLLRNSPHFNRLLLGPSSILLLLLASALAALVSALVAMPATRFLLEMDHLQAISYWLSAELVCYMALLPSLLLTANNQPLAPAASLGRLRWAPLATLLASAVLALLIGGPGALVFCVPALLWCALLYPQRLTALCTLVVCIGTLLCIATGQLRLGVSELGLAEVVSLRLGMAMLAVAPLMVSAMSATRERMLKALHHAAAHDALTGILSRAGFFEQIQQQLRDRHRQIGTLMIDIDLFKQINDRYGHASGDRVLSEVAQRLRTSLPESAMIGRLGGEEFAVLLPDADLEQSRQLAETLRQRIDEEPFVLFPGLPPLAVTLSIGVAVLGRHDERHIDTVLHHADKALYRAKGNGRNQVMVAPAA
ncbi:hypothetical protein ABB30_04280 [Stenotrophomonas ginsengisoli]|uniref:diguanylate cyclase n=1 Tax=Stenotrophomonas ginsengisoli TaxID=336566 RepID=A0A0R0D7E7_9GAMM|nr:GGDEF domain-containing protein [Stenotrophomonas ginsengisoli]KRG78281.1 hypothetical protein ABB30_04280 [Stenotrophomonas ginsengisoli]